MSTQTLYEGEKCIPPPGYFCIPCHKGLDGPCAAVPIDVKTTSRVGDARFHAILQEMADLHAKKSADYGAGEDFLANLRASAAFNIPPWLGACVRMNDKMTRIKSMAVNGSLANESLEDSLLDIACYSILALILYRETNGKADLQV